MVILPKHGTLDISAFFGVQRLETCALNLMMQVCHVKLSLNNHVLLKYARLNRGSVINCQLFHTTPVIKRWE